MSKSVESFRVKMLRRKRSRFLKALRESGNVSKSLQIANWNRFALEKNLKDDKAFAKRYEIALDAAVDALEEEARRRAVEGVEDYEMYKGHVVYHTYPPGHEKENQLMLDFMGDPIPVVKKKHSDRLLEVLLKANRPEKFRENIDVGVQLQGGILLIGENSAPDQADANPELTWEQQADQHQALYRVSGEELLEREKAEMKARAIEAEIVEEEPAHKPKRRKPRKVAR